MKSCSFREDILVINVQAASALTGDKNELWDQKEDFDNFREKTRRIIQNVDANGRGKNGKKYCTRGLEKYMARAQEHRRLQKSILEALDEDEAGSHNSNPAEVRKAKTKSYGPSGRHILSDERGPNRIQYALKEKEEVNGGDEEVSGGKTVPASV